jgi:hypothetical protein
MVLHAHLGVKDPICVYPNCVQSSALILSIPFIQVPITDSLQSERIVFKCAPEAVSVGGEMNIDGQDSAGCFRRIGPEGDPPPFVFRPNGPVESLQ